MVAHSLTLGSERFDHEVVASRGHQGDPQFSGLEMQHSPDAEFEHDSLGIVVSLPHVSRQDQELNDAAQLAHDRRSNERTTTSRRDESAPFCRDTDTRQHDDVKSLTALTDDCVRGGKVTIINRTDHSTMGHITFMINECPTT